MKFDILLLGKTKDSFLTTGIEEYTKRLQHYTRIDVKILKNRKQQGSEKMIMEQEGDLLLANLSPSTYPIALDSRGSQFSSTEFARKISEWEQAGVQHATFLIGGPLGLSPKVMERARFRFSLSKMTFTHDMVRLFLLEQLYRAYTIKCGEKYHK